MSFDAFSTFLYECVTHQSFLHVWLAVDLIYDLILFNAENNFSLSLLVTGITNNSSVALINSERSIFIRERSVAMISNL